MDSSSAAEMETSSVMERTTEDSGGDGGMKTSSAAVSSKAAEPMAARTIEMSVENFAFTPGTLNLKKGEKVKLVLNGVSGIHSFASKDLGINQQVSAGETVTIEIPTDTAGTFSFRCAVPCGSGHNDMKGSIVISE